jgi:hypothetical protein
MSDKKCRLCDKTPSKLRRDGNYWCDDCWAKAAELYERWKKR